MLFNTRNRMQLGLNNDSIKQKGECAHTWFGYLTK